MVIITKRTETLRKLEKVSNVLPYLFVKETSKAVYFCRQYAYMNLYDRLRLLLVNFFSIRPFVEPIEKKWIAYQILVAFQQMHEREVIVSNSRFITVMSRLRIF